MKNKYYSFLPFDKTFLCLIMLMFFINNVILIRVLASELRSSTNSQAIKLVADKVKRDINNRLVFSGQVSVYNSEWEIHGAKGVLGEKIGKSQIIRVMGNPAEIKTTAQSQYGSSFGSAKELTLDLAVDKIELIGNAKFDSKSQSLRADVIYYDINTRSMKTKGSRVKFISESQN